MAQHPPRPALVLMASHGDWVGRSVESVLEMNEYSVLRVDSGRRALEMARRTNPDMLILDSALSDMNGIEVCAALVADPSFDPTVPIFLTAPAPVSNRVRMAAYEAGAWDFCSQPLDVQTLLLKMKTFLRARRRFAERQSTSLLDDMTGVYSEKGLRHLAAQLGARAVRNHEPLTCIAVISTASRSAAGRSTSAELNFLADVCRSQSRKSDVVGYVGDGRFAILAPGTDGPGARQFIGRLQKALAADDATGGEESRNAIHAGYCAVSDLSTAGLDANEVVRRAESALQHSVGMGRSGGALSFDELPIS